MKALKIVTAAALGSLLLAGCIHSPTGGSKVAYYDGAYGEYHGGFWGDDGKFYYFTDASQSKVAQDTAGHFQIAAHHGMVPVTARPRIYKMQDAAAAEAATAHAAKADGPAPQASAEPANVQPASVQPAAQPQATAAPQSLSAQQPQAMSTWAPQAVPAQPQAQPVSTEPQPPTEPAPVVEPAAVVAQQ